RECDSAGLFSWMQQPHCSGDGVMRHAFGCAVVDKRINLRMRTNQRIDGCEPVAALFGDVLRRAALQAELLIIPRNPQDEESRQPSPASCGGERDRQSDHWHVQVSCEQTPG